MITDEKVITLRRPVRIGSGKSEIIYEQLKLVEPTAGEYTKAMGAGDANEQLLALIHAVTKVPRQVVDAISLREMRECDRFFAQFSSEM